MFTHWIKGLLEAAAPHVVVEIGVASGETTLELLKLASQHDWVVHAIDPSPQPDFAQRELKERHQDRLVFHEATSLEALGQIEHVDAALIDGDHNWYTVYNELKLLEKKVDGKHQFPLTLLHDIDWPYGRRDLYYDPESIPEEYRQPYRRGGIIPGQAELSTTGGFNYFLYNAVRESTPRNGVLTAIEDFLAETDLDLRFQSVIGYHGTGIVISERQYQENADVRRQLEVLKSPAFLRAQCKSIEWSRVSTASLLDTAREELEAVRLELEEAKADSALGKATN